MPFTNVRSDNSVLVPAYGYFYINDEGAGPLTAAAFGADRALISPTPAGQPTGWKEIGHTTLDQIMQGSVEGGETTELSSLQKRGLRTVTSERTQKFTINLLQFDVEALKLYHGSNVVDINNDGSLIGVPSKPEAVRCAWQAVFFDGTRMFTVYAPSADITGADSWSIDSVDNLASLPLEVIPRNYQNNTWPYAVTPIATA